MIPTVKIKKFFQNKNINFYKNYEKSKLKVDNLTSELKLDSDEMFEIE